MRKANHQLSVRLSLLLAAVCTVFLLIGGSAEADGPQPDPVRYVVTSGDTLWAIASHHGGPESDLRRLVADIGALNGLDGDLIEPGQVLLLPPA